MESLSNLDKTLEDNRKGPMQLYTILQELYGILITSEKILQYYRQDHMKS